MRTLIITATLFIGSLVAHYIHGFTPFETLAPLASDINGVMASAMDNRTDIEVIHDRVESHPDEAPYWFGLLSTLATSLIAAIIRMLEKNWSKIQLRRKNRT